MNQLERWWSSGEHITVDLDGTERRVFLRRLGAGAPMTLLHGFPSCSYDWAGVVPILADEYAMLLPDLLGFGASEKPTGHQYSISEQADLVEALWAREGIVSTVLVAHDYSVSVVQELLARRGEDHLAVDLISVHLLNGGLYPDLHRPEPTQTALLDPEQGPRISAQLTEELLAVALRPTFAADFDPAAESANIWRATMAQRIRERLPRAPFTALADVGHWPPLEAPERVGGALLSADAERPTA